MLLRLKDFGNWRRSLLLAAALMLVSVSALAGEPKPAAAPVISLRVGEHADYTRLVFGFERLTAYTADKNDKGVALSFESQGTIDLPADTFRLISRLRETSPGDGTIHVDVDMPANETFKDYRLNNKIVLDVYAPGRKEPAAKADAGEKDKPPAEKPATKTAAVKPPAEKPITPVVEKPVVPPPVVPPAIAVTEQTPEMPVEQPPALAHAGPAVPALPVAAVIVEAAPPPEEEPTQITISTVEPTRLAVFSRFDILWIVMDSEAVGAIAPSVSGPEAGLLGQAKVLKFKGGTAYRYTIPPKRFFSVEKQSLTWRVFIAKSPLQSPARAQVNVEFDTSSGKAKLMAELKNAGNPLVLQDPATGDTLDIIPAESQDARIDQGRRFSNVAILQAAMGMVVRPLADDIRINRLENFIIVTAPDGIVATPGAVAGPTAIGADDGNQTRLFDFPVWRQGGAARLYRNTLLLENKIAAASKPEEKRDLLMKLALLYFANNFGQETLGVLRMLDADDEDLAKNPNFIALRGAASALAGHYHDALADLSQPALQQHPEVNLWIGYAAAASEQWHMANRSFPSSNRLLLQYPENMAVPFTIYMAESALRMGHTDSAGALLGSLDSMSNDFDLHDQAAVQYLKGEAARQAGKNDEAIKLWGPVAFGLDRLYHTKASLALANLRLQDKKLTLKQAIDAVDSLRFAWRGDGLEVQILHNLGDLKVRDGKFLSGLEDMKTAAALADEMLDDSQPIHDDMARIFSGLFVDGDLKSITPLEAVSIYTEFSTLMPQGAGATTATLNFADSLISIDLLDKAEGLLEAELKNGQLPADKTAITAVKLAAIYLLDRLPEKALSALDRTASGAPEQLREQRALLRARAFSQLGRTDDAIAALSQAGSDDAAHLKADILWRAKKWGQAAAAIAALLPPGDKPLTEEGAQMVLNAAVACKLAGDTAHLADLKARYGAAMAATKIGDTFGTVTRMGGASSLADRDTLLKITGEVDMFKGFLDTYKAGSGT